MRVVSLERSFGLENLKLRERDSRDPAPGEVRLRMRAASLNYRDLMMVRGHYNPSQPLPLIPCSDGVGVVEAVGDGVKRVGVGDRVCPIFAQGWIGGEPNYDKIRPTTLGGPLDGTLAEHMVVSAESVVKVPEYLEDLEAATLPCAALTAWSALVSEGGVTAGDCVLVQGSGGVALFALQIARALGARVIVTSSSDRKLERMRELGAEAAVNYRKTPKWGRAVRELSGGAGVDHVIEVGGAGTLAQSLSAVRIGGRISLIGVLSGNAASKLDITPIFMKNVRIQGLLVGSRDRFEAMCRAFEANEIQPLLDEQTFDLASARDAFEHLASGEHFGKVALVI
ncbi:MAG: NAD(P)-dependent alcohol dehydrogenase [Myxococcales bacterium]|nr:NAD(P)-dependent alcohol dehydrogenase [Myxococcales bacterium]